MDDATREVTALPPTHPFAPFFERQGFVLLDGGLATALEAHGHDLNDPLWSARVLLDAPDAVRDVHWEYLAAGADCIATVTYQATFQGFADRGLSAAEAEEAFRRAVRLALEAREAFWADPAHRKGRLRPLVAASVGPYGAFLADGSEYTGRYDLDEGALADFHRPRWAFLASTGADLLACETVPSLDEARALMGLLDGTPGRWAWMSFQCRDHEHLADGSSFAEAVGLAAAHPRVAAVGANCVPPALVPALLDRAVRATDGPVIVYPNSGERYDAERKAWSGAADGSARALDARAWRRAGADVVGGCCRTGPGDIRRMRASLELGLPLPSRAE